MKRHKKHGWIWLIVLAVVAAGVFFGLRYLNNKTAEAAQLMESAMQQTYTVERGDIETVIVANGTLAAGETVSYKVPDGLLVDEILVSVGEEVKKGQPIARVDEDSVRAAMANLQKLIKTEDSSLSIPGNNNKLGAPVKSRVKYIPVREGDDVLSAMEKFGALALLSTDGWMRLDIMTDASLTLGKRMDVQWDGGAVEGTVSRRIEGGYVILVPDERAPYLANAKLMDGAKEIGSGILTINMPMAIVGYRGTIEAVRFEVDQSVPNGREVFRIKDASPSISYETHYASYSQYAAQMVKLIRYFNNPQILAEADGIVSEISLKRNEKTGTTGKAENNAVAYTLATGGACKMNIEVDELDILKVTPDASVEIDLEALQGETLTGHVTAISKIGKKNNSVSVFPVELTLDTDERLLAGMTGSATILIDRAENVLVIPVAAIIEDETGSFVNVQNADGSSARVPITTGRSNGDMAEVTGGLAEGDVITYAVIGDLPDMTGVTVSTESEDGTVTMTDVG